MAAPVTIDELTAAGVLSPTASIPVFQNGDTFKTTPADIAGAASLAVLAAANGSSLVWFGQSGSGAIDGTVEDQLAKFTFRSDWTTEAQFNTARNALTGKVALPPVVDIAGPVSGAAALFPLTIRSGEPTAADFNFALSHVTSFSTVDVGLSIGYNCAPSASRRDSSEPAWMWSLESDYNDGSDEYMEMHFQGIHLDGTAFRNWSWQISRSTKTIVGSIACDSWGVMDSTRANQAFLFRGLTTTAGEFQISSGSWIRHDANNVAFLRQDNAAGSAGIELIRVNASDEVVVAPETGITRIGGVLYTPNGISTGANTNLSFSSSGGEQFRVNHVASAVNFLAVQGAATTGGVFVRSGGSDTNVNINYSTQGTGQHKFFSTGTSAQQFEIQHVASASRYIRVAGSNGGHPFFDTNNAGSFVGFGRSIVMTSQPSWIIQEESDTDPTTTELDAGDSAAVYNKNGKIVIAYNLAGVMNYLSCALDGSTVTWVNSTSAP